MRAVLEATAHAALQGVRAVPWPSGRNYPISICPAVGTKRQTCPLPARVRYESESEAIIL